MPPYCGLTGFICRLKKPPGKLNHSFAGLKVTVRHRWPGFHASTQNSVKVPGLGEVPLGDVKLICNENVSPA